MTPSSHRSGHCRSSNVRCRRLPQLVDEFTARAWQQRGRNKRGAQMSTPLRPILLTCGLVIAWLTVLAAQSPTDKPTSIVINVKEDGAISLDNGRGNEGFAKEKVWALAGGTFKIVVA